MDCQTVRTEIHIEPTNAALNAHLESCVRCAGYAEYMTRLDGVLRAELFVPAPAAVSAELQVVAARPARVDDRLDVAARDELLVAVPADLTARLQSLVVQPARARSPLDLALRDALVIQAPPELTARLQALVPQAAPAVVPEFAPAVRPRRWVVATVYFVTATLLLLSLMYAGQIYGLMIDQLGLNTWLSEIARLPAALLQQLYTAYPQARTVVSTLVRIQQPLQWLLIALVVWAVVDMSQRQGPREGPRGQQFA
ncbi:MAG TPA: hypothetical protein VGD69_08225 [Herpetosiphonaceae bacterium]